MKLNDFDLFLFDFDGLLVDTEHLHYQAYKATLQELELHLPWSLKDYFAIAHVSSEHLRTTLLETFPSLKAIGWDQLYAEKKKNYLRLLDENKTQFMPGALPLLQYLHQNNIRSAVVTHSPLLQIETIRGQLPELSLIPHWFTREDYEKPKPAPDGYLRALSMLESQKPIGFEDSIRGLQSLQAAKIPAVLVRPPIYPPYETTDALCLQSLEQLLS